MTINIEDIEHLKGLAKLPASPNASQVGKFGEEESKKLAEDLSGILDFMKVLEGADVSGLREVAHFSDIKNVVREDGGEGFLEISGSDRIIEAFPEKESGGGPHTAEDAIWLKVKAPIKYE